MNDTFKLVALGAASHLTQAGGGTLLHEENMILFYDLI